METLDDARTLISSTSADSSFEYQDLYLALRTLPPKERSAITLFYLSNYSIKEIAAITAALHLHFNSMHDEESEVITIHMPSAHYSPWAQKELVMKKAPRINK